MSSMLLFSVDQWCALGPTAAALRYRAATGRLHRIHAGVYSLVPRELLKREGLSMAAVLACGPGAVLSHRSAAVLHELRLEADEAKHHPEELREVLLKLLRPASPNG
jgi:hypothetical protein